MGRFLETDPIGFGGGMNIYAYAGNDPFNGTDSSGLTPADFDCSGPGGCITVHATRDDTHAYVPAPVGGYATPGFSGGLGEAGEAAGGGDGQGKNDKQKCPPGHRPNQPPAEIPSFVNTGAVAALERNFGANVAARSTLQLLSRVLAPLAIHQLLAPGVRNDPHVPIFRGVGQAELTDIFSTTPASFRPGPGMLDDKQFFLTLQGAQTFANISETGVDAIVSTRVRPSTLQQSTPFHLTSAEGGAAVSFPPAALPSLNADAAQTGIQIVQKCGQ